MKPMLSLLLAVLIATPLTTAAPQSGAEDPDQLQSRIASLEAELDRLKRSLDDDWLTERRADEIRSLVQDVLADADTRASLLQNGLAAGYENGFFIASSDGSFRLNVNGLAQFRFVYNRQDQSPVDDDRWGFENTRTKLRFSGHVVDPSWIYMIEGNFDRVGGSFELEDAYIGHALGDSGWTALAGQFKVPMLREELVYSAYQQLVERSLVNEEFTAGRTQGVALDYRNDQFHFTGGYTDGHPATGGFNMPALSRDTEYSLTGRLEVLLSGDWDQFTEFASWPGEDFGFLVGGAIHYQYGEFGTPDNEIEVLQWTVDGSLEFGGANVFAYVVGRHLDEDAGPLDLDQLGVVVQGGLFVTEEWELFARYEWGDSDLPGDDLSVVTVGANRYFARQQLKCTLDVGFGINEVTSTWGDGFLGQGGDIAGWRTDAPGEDGQVVTRWQVQLLF